VAPPGNNCWRALIGRGPEPLLPFPGPGSRSPLEAGWLFPAPKRNKNIIILHKGYITLYVYARDKEDNSAKNTVYFRHTVDFLNTSTT